MPARYLNVSGGNSFKGWGPDNGHPVLGIQMPVRSVGVGRVNICSALSGLLIIGTSQKVRKCFLCGWESNPGWCFPAEPWVKSNTSSLRRSPYLWSLLTINQRLFLPELYKCRSRWSWKAMSWGGPEWPNVNAWVEFISNWDGWAERIFSLSLGV